MKIAVIDTLIQTVNFDEPVRGGLVRAAIHEITALAEKHDVHYIYYGKPSNANKFKCVPLDSLGSKDWCVEHKKDTKWSHLKLRKDTEKLLGTLESINPEVIIVHVCSKSKYLEDIAKRFLDIPKIYVFYDGVSNNDLFGTAGIIGMIIKLRKYGSLITAISNFTKNSIVNVMIDREKDMRLRYDFMKEIKDVRNYTLIDKVYDHFVYYDNNAKIEIVENQPFSVNIGRFQKKKGVLSLLDLHKHSKHKVRLYGVKDPVFDPGLKDYAKIIDHVKQYDNYVLCENFSDEKLRKDAMAGQNIVISCPVEGFGYTAFEMGVFGMPCVILKNGDEHATEEYLSKAGVSFVTVNMAKNKQWKPQLYKAMEEVQLTLEEKKINSEKFLNYFTIDKYIQEQEYFIELARKKLKNTKTLF